MKVVGISGSARKDGNTAMLINAVFERLKAQGIETELIQLAARMPTGCIACYKCFERKDKRCAVQGDIVNECIERMLGADGIILGSPTYFADMSAGMKAVIERAGMVSRANDWMFKGRVGAAVVAVRRAGATTVLSNINFFFLQAQMVIPGSSYWNLGMGRNPGEVSADAEGMDTMLNLGDNMAWVMKKLRA